MNDIPWVEKYRPKLLNNVVLDENNKEILNNIISKRHFPNLLFYGPPGTGKTTTMVNLINLYQKDIPMKKGLCIHLNASDERGIDTIRYQISTFVNSSGLFTKGTKFIILDEVDYMTKSAQLGLKYLIETSNDNVRYCLICNYISKIDKSLQNCFLKLKFNILPKDEIIELLNTITVKEGLNLNSMDLCVVQEYFGSDVRSMINYIQTNKNDINIINKQILEQLLNNKSDVASVISNVNKISVKYNVDRYSLIKEYIKYIIFNKRCEITQEFLISFEMIIRNLDTTNNNNFNQIIIKLLSLEIL